MRQQQQFRVTKPKEWNTEKEREKKTQNIKKSKSSLYGTHSAEMHGYHMWCATRQMNQTITESLEMTKINKIFIATR